MTLENIKIETDDKNIIIIMPIEILNNLQQNRLDIPLIITNIDKMKKWIVDNLLTFQNDNNKNIDDENISAFELFINSMFVNAYEHAEAWLEGYIGESKKLKRKK